MGGAIGEAFVVVRPDTRGFAGAAERSIGGTFRKLAGLATGIFAGVAVTGVFKNVIEEALEAQKVAKQTAAVIKSTGGAAGVTAKHVDDLATAISRKTGIDDEAIAAGENLLLTFTNVRNEVGKGNDIFDQATRTITDMSVALGQDSKSSAIQLGKALNDPIKGVTALQRVGVSFTKDQKEQIKTLVATGDTLGAQKLILAELTKEFGGSAEAVATPFGKLKVTLGNLAESLGTALLPTLNRVATFLADNLPGALDAVGGAFGRVKAVITPFIDTLKLLAGTFAFALDPRAQVDDLTGLQRVIGELGITFRNVIDFIEAKVVPVFRDAITFAVGQLRDAFNTVREAIEKNGPQLQSLAAALGVVAGFIVTVVVPAAIKLGAILMKLYAEYIAHVINAVGAMVSAFQAVIRVIGTLSVVVPEKIGQVVAFVQGMPGRIVAALGNVGSLLLDAGRRLIDGFLRGIRDKFDDVKNTLGNLTGKLTSWKGPPGTDARILYPAGQSVLGGFIGGIESKIPDLRSVLNGVTAMLPSAVLDSIAANDAADPNRNRPGWIQAEDGSWVNPNFYAPRFHSGGVFRSRTPGGEGLAILQDGERVVPSGGGVTVQNLTVTALTEEEARRHALVFWDEVRKLEREAS